MNKLKEKLRNKEFSFGTWIQIPSPAVVEIIAYNSYVKMDWICIDMEHGSIDIETMVNMIRVIEEYHMVPVVRIPKNDSVWIHRVLDAGAKGIVIPMINTREEAIFGVNESLYPPLGKRSFGYSRTNKYGSYFNEYITTANDDIVVILQIEHIDAISYLDTILKVPYIDGTFIGPLDLAGSMNLLDKMEGNTFQLTLKQYRNMSNELGVPTGMHVVRPSKINIKEVVDHGYKMIAIGLDGVFLEEKIKDITYILSEYQ